MERSRKLTSHLFCEWPVLCSQNASQVRHLFALQSPEEGRSYICIYLFTIIQINRKMVVSWKLKRFPYLELQLEAETRSCQRAEIRFDSHNPRHALSSQAR